MIVQLVVLLVLQIPGLANRSVSIPGPRPGFEPVKLDTGPRRSDQWHRGWAPRARQVETDPGDWRYWGEPPEYRLTSEQAAAAGDDQYIAGGFNVNSLNALYRNDLVSRNWDTLAPMPHGFGDGAAAIIGDTLYVHGGYSYSGGTVNRLCKYSRSANTWTSDTGCCLYNWKPCMVALHGRLYYMGGCATAGARNPSVQTWCYTPGMGQAWVRKADMHTGRVLAQAVAYEGKIYMAGGIFDTSETGPRTTEVYDPVANTWTQDSSLFPYLPRNRWAGATGCANSTFFIYGGGQGQYLATVGLEYDFDAHVWDTFALAPGSGRGGAAVVNSLNQGVVFEVYDTAGPGLHAVYRQFPLPVRFPEVSPRETIDVTTLTPWASVLYRGTSPETLRVGLTIAGEDSLAVYFDAESLRMEPGETRQVWFAPWTTAPGRYSLRVWALGRSLASDTVQWSVVVRGEGVEERSSGARAGASGLLVLAPHPVPGKATIRYQIARPGRVELRVLDPAGQTVRTLARGFREPGEYAVPWDCSNDQREPLPRGIYFIRLKTPGFEKTQKAVLTK